MSDEEQEQLPLDGLGAMPSMPRCERTGQNADLHLVVCTPPDENGPVARIYTTQVRHLYRDTTTLSIPLWILTLDSLGRLEQSGKIPKGSAAAESIRKWLQYDREATWKELIDADRLHQEQLDLDDEPSLKLEDRAEGSST